MNMSFISVTQNLFYQGKEMRDVSLRSQYLIVFKNRRGQSQIMHLARQLYPVHPKFFREMQRKYILHPLSWIKKNQTDEGMRM